MIRKIHEQLLALAIILVALGGCSPVRYIDTDASCNTPRDLPPGNIIPDEIDVPKGDRADCKRIRYFKDATALVKYRVGNAFDKHSIRGVITLYDDQARLVDQRIVDPRQKSNVYEFQFKIRANQEMFISFKATHGRAGYTAQVGFVRDPCSACTTNQKCVDGQCRDLNVCTPECNPDSEICEAGRCVFACGSPCSRGTICNPETRLCERTVRNCSPRCRRGFKCDRRRGTCKRVRVQPRVCRPACTGGTRCRNGRCVSSAPRCPASCPPNHRCDQSTSYQCRSTVEPPGAIRGQITTINRAGNNTTIYVNRGARNGVTVGMTGRLCNRHRFRITRVFTYRSRATARATIEEIGSCTSVVIQR